MLIVQSIVTNPDLKKAISNAVLQWPKAKEPLFFDDFDSFWSQQPDVKNTFCIFEEALLDLNSEKIESRFRKLKSPKMVVSSVKENAQHHQQLFSENNTILVSKSDFSESFTSLFFEFGTVKSLVEQLSDQIISGNAHKSSLVHELKNATMVIRGKAQRILESVQTQKSQDPWIQNIKNDCTKIRNMSEKVKSLTNDLFALSGGSPNHFPSQPFPEKVQIIEATWVAIEESLSTGSYAHIRVTESVDHELYIKCDKNAFIQFLVNLIKNSCEAINTQKNPWININMKQVETNLVIEVIDSGTGIESADQIFQPYYTTKTDSGGTGLGLGVVQRYLKSIGGTIEYTKKDGHTCFQSVVRNVFKTSSATK